MKRLHLDSEYRDRYIKFYLVNGAVEDSRVKNWRQVPWDQVICLAAYLCGHKHTVTCKGLGFKAFMNFRWGGQEYLKDGSIKPIKIWTIGWTDGVDCFLKDIDFYTGRLIKEYKAPLNMFKGHIHPAVANRFSGRK